MLRDDLDIDISEISDGGNRGSRSVKNKKKKGKKSIGSGLENQTIYRCKWTVAVIGLVVSVPLLFFLIAWEGISIFYIHWGDLFPEEA